MSADNGLNSQLLLQDDSLRFSSGAPNRRNDDTGGTKMTRELTGFTDDKLFSSRGGGGSRYFSTDHHSSGFPRNLYRDDHHRQDPNWHGNGTSSDESDGDDDDDDDDDVEDDDDVDNRAVDNINKGSNNVATTCNINNASSTNGTREEAMAVKDGNDYIVQAGDNSVTIAEADREKHYSQYLQAMESSGNGGKDQFEETGSGFSARKEAFLYSSESGESLRAILSDPIMGALMDDAMILPCGHSFGSGGIQQVLRMKSCYTCSRSISEDSVAPNLSLRAAVQAFRREEDLQIYRSSKRRRERLDQDKGNYGDSNAMDPIRGRGVQFPFAVMDRVIIKGNKRTPERFVGREAVVTTQCLNGWYVVKTLDNAESVKLQYRSLAKISDGPSSKAIPSKITPDWL